ncbi:type II secretion system major pseudopilin GspG [Pelomonas sp. SE-A7]|uniref:type II secretion system major pseudopilin GspG n=1 Tax=Pelomonas sp. SE-A7 TaxID=3054953 RepID=UPI00259CEBE7|nr:type II secretion system major pseudopilin GspG [Pelomonas sp. SE-A7]MDM4767547.1 type II secretion system major pseudopilin GspG [Pelomonas sp. SE-A7]
MPKLESSLSRQRGAGFTLLEMLVVLVIIGLIAGLVVPRVTRGLDKSQVTAATAQIKILRGAVESLRLDIGRYPSNDEGLSMVFKAPSDPVLAGRWRGPYLDEGVPLDPWGKPYQYAVPGRDGLPFALYSFGSDGKPGGEGDAADIGSLPPQ